MHRNMCVLVGALDTVVEKSYNGQKIVFFTLTCNREDGIEHDKVECKIAGINAELFNKYNIPGNVLTVLGKLASREYEDGSLKTGVCVAHICEGDLFDVSDESDSCRLRRIARMYDEAEEDFSGWTDEMLEEWDHANREQMAFLRGKYGTPPQRRREKK